MAELQNSSNSGPQKLSEELEKSTLFITVIVGIYVVVGLFGNLSVFYVYLFKYPRCNFKYFIVSLAIIDMVSCVTTMPGEIILQRTWFSLPDNLIWLCKTKTFFNGFTVFIGAFILLLIAIDRFRKVCRPLKWQIKPRRAIQLSGMIFLIAVVLATPAFFLWGKQTASVTVDGVNMTVSMCDKDDNMKDTIWPRLYVMAVFFSPTLGFMITTVVLYGLIMKEIFCGSLALKNISTAAKGMPMTTSSQSDCSRIEEETTSGINPENESDEELKANKKPKVSKPPSDKAYIVKKVRIRSAKLRLRRKTMIMFVLTAIFTITTFVYFVILYKVSKKGNVYVLDMIDKVELLFFFWRLYFINHVINPFVYGIMDVRFRETVLKLLCRRQNWSPK